MHAPPTLILVLCLASAHFVAGIVRSSSHAGNVSVGHNLTCELEVVESHSSSGRGRSFDTYCTLEGTADLVGVRNSSVTLPLQARDAHEVHRERSNLLQTKHVVVPCELSGLLVQLVGAAERRFTWLGILFERYEIQGKSTDSVPLRDIQGQLYNDCRLDTDIECATFNCEAKIKKLKGKKAFPCSFAVIESEGGCKHPRNDVVYVGHGIPDKVMDSSAKRTYSSLHLTICVSVTAVLISSF